LKQITSTLGYDGGAAFSADGSQIVWRASRPSTPDDIKKYRELLQRDLVEPTNLEIFVANADGSNVRQVTNLGNANWSPYFHPDGKHILFCSNHKSKIGFPFNIFMVNIDGTGLEQVTFDTQFDSFIMFSPDGIQVVARAGFEISNNCPAEYKSIFVTAINAGWLKPIAHMRDVEYTMELLQK
jgi:Tol biopolymer transport system component